MKFKDNVSLHIPPFAYEALLNLEAKRKFICPESPELLVTSGNDSRHTGTSGYVDGHTPPSNSRHYLDLAVDVRSHDIPDAAKDYLLQEMRQLYPTTCRMILEFRGQDEEHFHLSFYL